MPEEFEEVDKAFVLGLLGPGWTPDPLPSPAWGGIVLENGRLPEDPKPTGRAAEPCIFAAWRPDYDEIENSYGQGLPVRYGHLTFAIYIETGARTGAIGLLKRAICARLDQAEELFDGEGPLAFNVETAQLSTMGRSGNWFVQNLKVPFTGG